MTNGANVQLLIAPELGTFEQYSARQLYKCVRCIRWDAYVFSNKESILQKSLWESFIFIKFGEQRTAHFMKTWKTG